MIRRLTAKDKLKFLAYCERKDSFADFYVTKNNNRLFLSDLKVAEMIFWDIMKRSDICYVSEAKNEFDGILLVIGYADKAPRKYIKILSNTTKIADGLIRTLFWNCPATYFLKIKKENSLIALTRKYRFQYIGNRGYEILFNKKIEIKDFNRNGNRNYSQHYNKD